MTKMKSFLQTVIWGILFIGLTVGLIGLFSAASRSPTAASSPPVATQPVDVPATETAVPTASPTQVPIPTSMPAAESVDRGWGYPMTNTTPGGVAMLATGDAIVVPNPVHTPFEQWRIYKDPFYTYTVAYPPEWFLIAPPPDAIEKAYAAGAKTVLGLGPSINSVDTSKAPETEFRTLNPQDALTIDITVDDYPINPGESLKEWMARLDRMWPESITNIEEVEFKGLPALVVHHRSIAPWEENLTVLSIYIAAKDGRVFRIAAAPDPKDTIYPDVFKQILDSFTILEQ
jgi:hypothetical protein